MKNQLLRKAAILIDTLDKDSADALLQQMPAHQRVSVLDAVSHLSNVLDDERQHVIQEFFQGDEQAAATADDTSVSGDLVDDDVDSAATNDVAVVDSVEISSQASDPGGTDEVPFGFLKDATATEIAKLFCKEYPQTISVVLSHLTPQRAGEVLVHLQQPTRADVLRRLTQMDATDSEVLADLHFEIKRSLELQQESAEQQRDQLATLSAILESMNGSERCEMVKSIQQHDQVLAERLGLADEVSADCDSTGFEETLQVDDKTNFENEETSQSLDFDDLLKMNDAALIKLFRAADPNVAMLALTGASRALIDRILARLPLRQAKQLSRQLEELGPTPLRDLEKAQSRMLLLAAEMANQGVIDWPAARRLSVAA